ncbi:hypothetical protein LCGC14_0903860 [marine sediment metagenome]|uniref:Uncharacterized protein n=1 Tax=marine sediment metagenome TaxID=412755 RepID=A0A0F9REM4_9ZZZZ
MDITLTRTIAGYPKFANMDDTRAKHIRPSRLE